MVKGEKVSRTRTSSDNFADSLKRCGGNLRFLTVSVSVQGSEDDTISIGQNGVASGHGENYREHRLRDTLCRIRVTVVLR